MTVTVDRPTASSAAAGAGTETQAVPGESLRIDHPERGRIVLRVESATSIADGIRHVTFSAADGSELPGYVPGSHIVLDCGPQIANAYSLVGEFDFPERYEISVRLDPNGRGGSRFVHDLVPGQLVRATTPRGSFWPEATAHKLLLIAGGIGITPILSHLRHAVRWSRPAEVVYSFRPDAAAHLDDVRELCAQAELPLHTMHDIDEFTTELDRLLADQPLGTHVYTCGPAAMIEAVAEHAVAAGWPRERVHSEAFTLGELGPGEPFVVRVRGLDLDVPVPSGVSMLDALESAGVAAPSLCRRGVCGECRLDVVSGTPLHRDLYLTDEQREAGRDVMPCVSRCAGDLLEVKL